MIMGTSREDSEAQYSICLEQTLPVPMLIVDMGHMLLLPFVVMAQEIKLFARSEPGRPNILLLGFGTELLRQGSSQAAELAHIAPTATSPDLIRRGACLAESRLELVLASHPPSPHPGAFGLDRVYSACLLYTSPSPRDATLSREPAWS